MPKPGEHKTVQARILEYAEAIGWTNVSREEAELRRGFDPNVPPADRAKNRSLFFDDLLDAKVREFNPRYPEAEGALLGQFRHLHTDIYGNREFVEHLRNRGKFFDHEEKRERDLVLIDYDDLNATPARRRNVYEVTEEWAFHNGHHGTREDVVFAEKDEEMNKYILRQHQTGAVEATVSRALDPKRTRGLVWHTQGSGKAFTMIVTAERLFRAPEADKPTVLLMIDRNELEHQMLKNLAALGLGNLEHASSIARLNQLLKDDYRGIIVRR